METTVRISDRLERILHIAENNAVMEDALNEVASEYRTMMMKRYKAYSRGGGDWKPLSPATIARRRKGKGKGSDKILIDTGGLIQAVGVMTHVGAENKIDGTHITIGFSDRAHEGGDTYNQIASWHQNGVPQRKILVEPDAGQTKKLERIATKVIQEYINK
jgi:hypothetical protein